jgi:hypothetical protein
MKSTLRIAMLSLSVCLPAQAYEVQTGPVIICDSQRQAERYAELFDGNQQLAIRTVNSEENTPNACAVVNASYIEGPRLGAARSSSHTFQIVPVVVIAVTTRDGSVPAQPSLFFTVIEIREFGV